MSSAATSSLSPAASPPVKLFRRVFSFPVAICSLLGALAVCTVRGRFDDLDMWWHLRTGQLIWTTHRIPAIDSFSWTTNHHPTTPHEWLAQLSIFAAYHVAGYFGLMFWLCLTSTAVVVAGYVLCSLYSGNAKVALLGALSIWLCGTSGFAIRPQAVGYFLLIVELIVLHLGRTRDPRWFFALPPLLALWVNCHGSFFVGLVVACVFLFSSFFTFQIGSLVAFHWEPRRSRTLIVSLLLCLVAILLNPNPIRVIRYPLDMLFGQTTATGNISEWLPLELNSPRGIALMVIIGSIILAVIAHRAQLFWHELLLMVLGIWLAVSHRRLIFPFGILAAPVLSRVFASSWENYDAAQDRPLPNAVLVLVSLLVMYSAFPSGENLALQVERTSPVKAVEYVNTHNLRGPMLNDFADGGYLIWAAPDHPVFIDGRADIFEWTGVLAEYGQWATLQADPRALLDKYRIRFCLLERTSPMVRVMGLLPEWRRIYADNVAVIFVRPAETPADKDGAPQVN